YKGIHFFHFLERLADDLETVNKILREVSSPPLPHLDHLAQRIPERFLEGRPDFVRLDSVLGKAHYARGLQDHPDIDFPGHAQFRLQRTHVLVIGTGQSAIELQLARRARVGRKRDHHIGPPAGQPLRHRLPDTRLEHAQISWEIDHDVALPAIDRIDLHADFRATALALAAAISGHASHWVVAWKIARE